MPTYGWLLQPWLEYQTPQLLRNVLGWDAYLTPSARVGQWIEDIAFGARKRAPLLSFVPAPPSTPAPVAGQQRTGVVVAPGSREAAELGEALGPSFCTAPGPDFASAADWTSSLVGAGVGAWFGSAGEVADGQVSLELLEIIAAGAVAITTRSPFTDQWFGDALLYVDAEAPFEVRAWQVQRHLAWVRDHPREADALAARAHQTFATHFALDIQLSALRAFHARVVDEKAFLAEPLASPAQPTVTYIVRTDGAPERVLRSLRAQEYPGLKVVVVSRSPGFDVQSIVGQFPDLSPTVLPPVPGCASSALWEGLRVVRDSTADLFGIVEDRDELFPNHVRTLARTLQNMDGRSWFGSYGVAYSGAVECASESFERDRLAAADAPSGHLARRIRHFRFYHPGYLDDGAHEVHPGALLARTSLLDNELLTDPEFEEGSERYLELLLAEKTLFAFSCEVTAATHDRDDDTEGERQASPADAVRQRIFFRTYARQFPTASVYLHNVIFMTAFDKALLAPIIQPGSFEAQREPTALGAHAFGGAEQRKGFIRVAALPQTGVHLALTSLMAGRYRVRCYFSAGDEPVSAPPFAVSLHGQGGEGGPAAALASLRPIEYGSVAEYEMHVAHEDASQSGGLVITSEGLRAFDFIGARVDRLARILSRSVLDLPVDRPVWLYGAGQGGRQAKRKLELVGLRVSGFIDKFKTGTLDGLPVVSLDTARQQLRPDTTLIIASMFWEEIRRDIEAAGVPARLYSLYPFTGDVVYALN